MLYLLRRSVARGYMRSMSNAGAQVVDGIPQWSLGDRLAKARKVADLTREDMAEYLGLSPQAVSNYELDKRPVKLQTVRLWAIRCGVDFDWLNTGSQPQGKGPGGAVGAAEQGERHLSCMPVRLRAVA